MRLPDAHRAGLSGCQALAAAAACLNEHRWPLAPPTAGNIEISFSLPYHCKYGQRLCVIGASDKLGAWDVAQAVPMEWTDGDVWMVDLKLPAR